MLRRRYDSRLKAEDCEYLMQGWKAAYCTGAKADTLEVAWMQEPWPGVKVKNWLHLGP